METERQPRSSQNPVLQRLALEIATERRGEKEPIRILVNGRSMLPTLRPGDTILVKLDWEDQLHLGSVITFLDSVGPVTHRVVGFDSQEFLTKGDHAPSFDVPVGKGSIVGLALERERQGINTSLAPGRQARAVARVSTLEGKLHVRFSGAESESGLKKSFLRQIHRIFRVTIHLLARN